MFSDNQWYSIVLRSDQSSLKDEIRNQSPLRDEIRNQSPLRDEIRDQSPVLSNMLLFDSWKTRLEIVHFDCGPKQDERREIMTDDWNEMKWRALRYMFCFPCIYYLKQKNKLVYFLQLKWHNIDKVFKSTNNQQIINK